ncbi:MAG: serine/threonine protein kinase, CMGC, CDC2/CDK sub [Chrysothrix sp. TS-e1954]|nr:MAG: serine/threonine protein kinase, CMGC, CDC2/CDK sub [Chrysothrix sp. TS-e1954]
MAVTSEDGVSDPPQRVYKGCSRIEDYDVQIKLGEGTFGEVYKGRSKRNNKIVALKKILIHNEKDGFPITALREIKLLKMLDHVNVLRLSEMAIEKGKNKDGKPRATMYMITPYMEHDLSGLLENPDVQFTEPQIKCYMLQLLEGMRYLHDNRILHRDLKAANLLISNRGILQIADFGLARHYDEPTPQRGTGGGEAKREYTTLVVTRWYRPPELLLQLRKYTTAIDMWGVGCVFGEMFKRRPILPGKTDLNQIQQIFELVGSPTEENMPGWSSLPGCEGTNTFKAQEATLSKVFKTQSTQAVALLSALLTLDWRRRINAIDALHHPYFRKEPLPARPETLPKYDDSHELDRRRYRDQKAAQLPPAPAGGTVGLGPEGEWAAGQQANGVGPGPGTGPAQRGERGGGGGGWGRDRDRDHHDRPPRYDGRGAPPPHDNRRGPGPSRDAGQPPPQRQNNNWRDRPRDAIPPRPPQGHALPARPNDTLPNGRPPRNNVDTYVPPYSSGGPRQAPRHPDEPSRRPRPDDRDNRRPYHDRDRVNGAAPPRSRSRSPTRNNAGAGAREPERDRRERDRDLYRR